MIEKIFYNFLELSISASLAIVLALIVFKIWEKKYSVKWRKILWIIITIRLLIPINYTLDLTSATLGDGIWNFSQNTGVDMSKENNTIIGIQNSDSIVERTESKEDEQVNTDLVTNNSENNEKLNNQDSTGFNLQMLDTKSAGALSIIYNQILISLKYIWLTGTVIYIIFQFLQYRFFRRKCSKTMNIITDKEIRISVKNILREYGVKKSLTVYTCKTIPSPLITGYRKIILLLPDKQYNTEELTMILRHECYHCAQNDLWYKLIMTFAVSIHWFNPFVHIMARQSYKDLELLCDSAVVQEMNNQKRADYIKSILEVAEKGIKTTYSTCFMGGKKIMKSRIENIFDKSKKKKGMGAFVSLFLLMMISSMLISCNSTIEKNETISEESSTQVISEDETATVGPETALSEEVIDPYIFEVNDLLETRMDKPQISDFYITNIGDPLNLYYIDDNNVLWGCGYNQYGQLGQGTQSEELNPKMVKIAENVVHVDYSQTGYTVYLTEDHKLYGMGTNATGALLEDITVSLEEAHNNARFHVVTSPKLLMENVSYVSLGEGDVVVLKDDNTVWTWGERWYSGRLINGEVSDYDREPTKLLENVKLITGGRFNHAALLADGTLWTWGYNYTGNCGIDGDYFISEPQQVASDVKMVWTGRLAYNINATDINELNNTYERSLENTIIEKTDGSFFACGVNIGGKEKTLDYYYEVGDPYNIVCTSEFLPCTIIEKKEKDIDTILTAEEIAKKEEAEKYSDTEIYGTIEDKKQEYTGDNPDVVTYYYEVERFYFNDDFPVAINNTLKQIYDEHEKIYKEGSSNYSSGKVQETIGEEEEPPSYNFFHFLEIDYIGDDYISILYNDVSYMGGIHPYSQYMGITINRKTGKLVTASELLGKSDDEILKEVSETMGMEVIATWDDIGFYITDSTIAFFYRMPNYWDDVVWSRN